MSICRHYFIEGRVQGVFYRHNTEKKAKQLNLTGWVRNCEDGRVECMACGDEKTLEQFEAFLWKGPVAAKVKNVLKEDHPEENFESFQVKS